MTAQAGDWQYGEKVWQEICDGLQAQKKDTEKRKLITCYLCC